MKKQIIASLLGVTLVATTLASPAMAKSRFSDVASGSWYESYVDYVADKKLMTGVSSDSFAPEKQVTRAELVQTLYAMAGRPTVADETSFVDLSQDWYKNATIWASNCGVTGGVDYTHFAPNSGVTREQVATFLRAYAEQVDLRNTKVSASISSYKDASQVSSWAVESVQWAVAKGLLSSASTQEKILNPNKIIKRAELATMLTNYTKIEYPTPVEAGQNLYSDILDDLSGRTFVFSSGAGGWANTMEISSNGRFQGSYFDSNFIDGVHVNAEHIYCNYSGKFYVKRKISDTCYVLGITSLKTKDIPGHSTIDGTVLKVAAGPYGLNYVDDVILYLPGTPTSTLSEEYKFWDYRARTGSVLDHYGLYNVNAEQGWYESEG